MAKQVKESVEFYCVKCRAKCIVPLVETERESRPRGADILRSKCSMCGSKMVKLVKRQAP